jgi:hypothetical protein
MNKAGSRILPQFVGCPDFSGSAAANEDIKPHHAIVLVIGMTARGPLA